MDTANTSRIQLRLRFKHQAARGQMKRICKIQAATVIRVRSGQVMAIIQLFFNISDLQYANSKAGIKLAAGNGNWQCCVSTQSSN
jgi:hypothetical protein